MKFFSGSSNTQGKIERILQDLKIAFCALLAVLMAVLFILELIPKETAGLQIVEPVRVSPSVIDVTDGKDGEYACMLSGMLSNTGDENVTIDEITVTVGKESVRKTVVLDGFALPARTQRELSLVWTGEVAFDSVYEVVATVDGAQYPLSNTGASLFVSGLGIVYLACMIVAVLLLIRLAKVRYYMHQESAMKRKDG